MMNSFGIASFHSSSNLAESSWPKVENAANQALAECIPRASDYRMRIIFTRHGESENNVMEKHYGKVYEDDNRIGDPRLSDVGIEASKSLGT